MGRSTAHGAQGEEDSAQGVVAARREAGPGTHEGGHLQQGAPAPQGRPGDVGGETAQHAADIGGREDARGSGHGGVGGVGGVGRGGLAQTGRDARGPPLAQRDDVPLGQPDPAVAHEDLAAGGHTPVERP